MRTHYQRGQRGYALCSRLIFGPLALSTKNVTCHKCRRHIERLRLEDTA